MCVSTREETRQQIQTMFQSQLKCLLSSKLFTGCKLQQFPIPKAPSRTQRMQRVWRCQASHVHTPASLTTLNLPGPTLGPGRSFCESNGIVCKLCLCQQCTLHCEQTRLKWTLSFFILRKQCLSFKSSPYLTRTVFINRY